MLNANYLLARLREEGVVAEHLPLAYGELCMHEFVLSGGPMKRELKIKTLDLAKRLLDFGFHPPTVYFPLLVDEALMVEPTETETQRDARRVRRRDRRDPARGRRRTRRSPRTRPTRRRCAAWTRSPRPSARSSARRSSRSSRAHLLRHPADGAQAPGQLHRRDRPVRRRARSAARGSSASSTCTRSRSPTSPRELRERLYDTTAILLAAGLDPAALHPVPPERRAASTPS